MVNPVYLLPKSGLPTQPNVMQMRTLAATGAVTQTNGLVTNASVLPRTASAQAVTVTNLGAAKLVEFLNQLLELSQTSDSHSAVVRLIQALVNSELDASAFCDQLRVILKSANNSMDIAPFIKDNIDALRRDLANGLCRLSNIQPPTTIKVSISTNNVAPVLGVAASGTPGGLSVQVRPNVAMAGLNTSIAPRLGIPTISQPRIVGTLMSSTPSPVTAGQIAPVVLPLGSRPPITQPPLLAPAPPRTSTTVLTGSAVTANSATPITTLGPSVPKYRLTQPLNSVITTQAVATILPATSSNTVVSTRLTNATNTLRATYPNLRPVLAPTPISSVAVSGSSTNAALSVQSLKSNAAVSLPAIVRAKSDGSSRVTNQPSSTVTISRTSSQLLSVAAPAATASSITISATPSIPAGGVLLLDSTDKKTDVTDDSRFRSISPSRDKPFFPPDQIRQVLTTHHLNNLNDDAVLCLAHGLQSFMRSVLARVSIVVSHRLERLGDDPRLTQTDFVRDQLQFLQKLDEHDMMRQSELEKDLILKAAKSRSRNEDPDQVRMREMARRIATEDYEREKQHQANLTALSAIGPQRKRRLDTVDETSSVILSDSGTGLPTTCDSLGTNTSNHSRLSLVSASRLSLLSTGQSGPGVNLLSQNAVQDFGQAGLFASGTIAAALSTSETGPTGSSLLNSCTSSFSLSHSARVHRASLRDIQLVLSRTPRLRRTRTFYRTHWRS